MTISNNVRSQYEHFPYPQMGAPREGSDCRTSEYMQGQQIWISLIDSYVFEGELIESRLQPGAPPLRILVAGGGTGRDAVFLAKELEHLGVRGTVTSFDFSAKAVDLARMWSEDCGLMQRINHKHASIEQFTAEHTAEHKEGFDIIMCSGVLHHLPNPLAGLKQLKSMLKPLGVIKLMVYGKYGRAGLKDVREALRLAIPPNELLTDPERLAELNSYMRSPGLPKTMMLQKNTEMAVRVGLHDAELFDRLLHAQEHVYSVPELNQLALDADMNMGTLHPEGLYNPNNAIFTTKPSKLTYMARRLRNRPKVEQFHFTELMTNRPILHYVLLTNAHAFPGPGGPEWQEEKRVTRRSNPEWLRTHSVVLIPPPFMFRQSDMDGIKKAVVAGQALDLMVECCSHMKGFPTAQLEIPMLTFAFNTATEKINMAADVVAQVHAEAVSWGAAMSTEDVRKEFFDWLDVLQSVDGVLVKKSTVDHMSASVEL